jgi:hypothetical protein
MRGKPYTVSEYGIPAPNDYTAETWPGLAVMGAFQDWDALYYFAHSGTPADYRANGILGWFEGVSHPSIIALMPSAALMFRTGKVQPARTTVTLNAYRDRVISDQTQSTMWGSFDRFWQQVGLSKQLALRHRVAIDVLEGSGATTVSARPLLTDPVVSDTNEITWNTQQATMTLNAPQARVAIGKIGNRALTLGDVRLQVGDLGGKQHAHVTLVSLDGKPLAQSASLLLTALGRSENQSMRWNANRTSVGPNWGSGPVVVQAVLATVTLPGGPWNVQALNASGNVQTQVAAATNSITLSAVHASPWYLITKAAAP